MKKTLAVALVLLFAFSTLAFAHAGEVHSYMGTISMLHEDGSFNLKKTDGTTIHVQVAETTKYLRSDDRPATAKDLQAGLRVVVKMAADAKTALSVKMAAPPR